MEADTREMWKAEFGALQLLARGPQRCQQSPEVERGQGGFPCSFGGRSASPAPRLQTFENFMAPDHEQCISVVLTPLSLWSFVPVASRNESTGVVTVLSRTSRPGTGHVLVTQSSSCPPSTWWRGVGVMQTSSCFPASAMLLNFKEQGVTTEDPGRIPCICVCLHTRSPCPTAAPTSCCFWPCALSRNWYCVVFSIFMCSVPCSMTQKLQFFLLTSLIQTLPAFIKLYLCWTFYLLAILHVFLKTDDFKAKY